MSSTKKILIVGGYGEAGKRIAEILLSQTQCSLSIAGRSRTKAHDCIQALSRNYDGKRLHFIEIDVLSVDFHSVLRENSLLIMAVALPVRKVRNLMDALLKHQTHYIDLSPSSEKSRLFKMYQDRFKKANLCCILDAGADPGLPGLVARCVAQQHPSPRSLELAATYSSDEIGQAGAVDILNTDTNSARFFRKGFWRKTFPLAVKTFHFPAEFGKRYCLPLYLEEYREIPIDFPLRKIRTYHTAYNIPANLVFLLFKLSRGRLLPLNTAGRCFRSAIKRFTLKPFGLAVVAQVQGNNQQLQLQLWHQDLYLATAAPVAICARMLIGQKLMKRGCFYLGEAVQPEIFLEELIPFGFKHQFSALSTDAFTN